MNKKGFTMIELLAVIVLLASIALIVTPLVTNSVKNGKEKLTEQTKNNIIMAGKNWASDNKDKLSNNVCVKVDTLVNNGYLDNIDSDLKSNYVEITKDSSAYYYKFKENCEWETY